MHNLPTRYSHQSIRYSVVCTGNIRLMRDDLMNVENMDELKSWAFVLSFMIMLDGYMTGAFWIWILVL